MKAGLFLEVQKSSSTSTSVSFKDTGEAVKYVGYVLFLLIFLFTLFSIYGFSYWTTQEIHLYLWLLFKEKFGRFFAHIRGIGSLRMKEVFYSGLTSGLTQTSLSINGSEWYSWKSEGAGLSDALT